MILKGGDGAESARKFSRRPSSLKHKLKCSRQTRCKWACLARVTTEAKRDPGRKTKHSEKCKQLGKAGVWGSKWKAVIHFREAVAIHSWAGITERNLGSWDYFSSKSYHGRHTKWKQNPKDCKRLLPSKQTWSSPLKYFIM